MPVSRKRRYKQKSGPRHTNAQPNAEPQKLLASYYGQAAVGNFAAFVKAVERGIGDGQIGFEQLEELHITAALVLDHYYDFRHVVEGYYHKIGILG